LNNFGRARVCNGALGHIDLGDYRLSDEQGSADAG
jgi:hypothetical protein